MSQEMGVPTTGMLGILLNPAVDRGVPVPPPFAAPRGPVIDDDDSHIGPCTGIGTAGIRVVADDYGR